MQVYLLLFAVVPLLAQEHCCKKKMVNGMEYYLNGASADYQKFNCKNNCTYRGHFEGMIYCFEHGEFQPKCLDAKCLEASINPSSEKCGPYHSGANMTSSVLAYYTQKIEEYGNMNNSSLKDKLAWIQKDIYMTGQPFYKPTNTSYLAMVPYSKMDRFLKMDAHFQKHIIKLATAMATPTSKDDVNNTLDEMEKDMDNQTQDDCYMNHAAYFGVSGARLAAQLLAHDNNGENHDSLIKKMINAIKNNTYEGESYHNKRTSYRQKRQLSFLEPLISKVLPVVMGAATGLLSSVVSSFTGGGTGTPGTETNPEPVANATTMATMGAQGGVSIASLLGLVENLVKGNPALPQKGCFSTTSQVETIAGFKALQEVAIGDFIRTSSGGLETHFTEFLGWMDRQESSPVKMLQVWTSQNLFPLTLTGSHIVFTPTSTKYADELLPGDSLLHWNGTYMQEQQVSRILTSLEFGFWAPLTTDGTLLVDGYLTSCYASFPHQLSDIAMKPVKMLSSILLDNEDSQHKDGVRSVMKFIKMVGDIFGARKQKRTGRGQFPIVGENIDASFMDKSEF